MDLNLKRRIWEGAIVLFALVFCISAHAEAFMPGGRNPEGPTDMRPHPMSFCKIWQDPKVVNDLGLTDEQVGQLRDADFIFREKHLELKAQLDHLRLQMGRAFSEDTADEAMIRELARKIADLEGKMFVQGIESRLTAEKLLTSKQRMMLKRHELTGARKGEPPPWGQNQADPGDPK